MKITGKAWRRFKSNLKRNYIDKGREPFVQYPYIEPEDLSEFVQMQESEEAIENSSRYMALRRLYTHEHSMGLAGYAGKQAQWKEEDNQLTAAGIHNPWVDFPEGRSRNWLWGSNRLEVKGGVAEIKWNKESNKKLAKDIIEKNAHAESLGISDWFSENDVLSQCMDPEQSGRVRGVSC